MVLFYFLSQVLLLGGFYCIGALALTSLFNYDKKKTSTYFFLCLSMITGLVVIISVYALFFTKGITINILFLLMALTYIFYRRKDLSLGKNVRVPAIAGKQLLVIISALAGIYIIHLLRNHYFDGQLEGLNLEDYYYYGYTARQMAAYGVEGKDFHHVLQEGVSRYRQPYHYFDLWLTQFCVGLFRLPIMTAYLYVLTPVVAVLTFLGLLSVYEHFNTKSLHYIGVIICFLATFYFGVLPLKAGSFSPNVLLQPRSFPSFVFSSLAFVWFARKNYLEGIFALCCIPVMNVLGIPAILSSVFLLGCYFLFKKDRVNARYAFIYSLGVLAGIIGFYLLFGNLSSNTVSEAPTLKHYLSTLAQILFRQYLARIWFFYLPFIILLIIYYRQIIAIIRSNSLTILFFGAMASITLFMMAAFNFNIDAGTIGFFPLSAVITISLVFLLSNLKINEQQGTGKNVFKIGAVMLIGGQLLYSPAAGFRKDFDYNGVYVGKKFIQDLNSRLGDHDKGGFIYSDSTLMKNGWVYNPFVFPSVHIPGLFKKDVQYISLNAPQSLDSLKDITHIPAWLVEEGDFFRYMKNNPQNNYSLDEYRSAFLRENRLSFLVLQKGAAVPGALPPVSSELYDSISGFRVLFFKL